MRDGTMRSTSYAAVVLAAMVWGTETRAQVMNPADAQRRPSTNQIPAQTVRLRSFEMPEIVVLGQREPALREEDRIGTYKQPRWTAHRRFPTTRVYVLPEGQFEFEFWSRADVPKNGPVKFQHMYEVEMGLGNRMQLDLYLVARNEGEGETFLDQKFELRYAFADWGEIWGNPTVYLEYALRDKKQDKVEVKLLLGGEIVPRWHWGVNAVYETETGGETKEQEYMLTMGLSYTVVDEKLALGVEARGSLADEKGSRGHYAKEVLVGPSVQFRPLPNMHIDLAPLVGVTHDAPELQNWLNVGWEF